jgi:opacity protein-like surface antigen
MPSSMNPSPYCALPQPMRWRAPWRVLIIYALLIGATRMHAEAYIAAYIGGVKTKSTNVVLERFDPVVRLNFEKVPFTGKSFDSPVYYGYRAGYYFTKHIGVEVEFIHLKLYADVDRVVTFHQTIAGVEVRGQAPMSRYVDQFEVSHGLNMLLVNAVLRRALVGGGEPADARMALAFRAGAGPTIPHPEVIVFGAAGGSYEIGPVAAQAAAGIQTKLWRGLYALTEYKYTFTPASFGIPNGRARLDVHSHHVTGGLAVHF